MRNFDKNCIGRIVIILLGLIALLTADLASARERKGVTIGIGSDLVSGYVWRGIAQAGVSFQPSLTLTAGNFSATAWGSVDFAATTYKEMDLTLYYTLKGITFSIADLYWEGSSADRRVVSRNYFDFGVRSPHRIEAGISWRITERVPITLSWQTVLFGAADINTHGKRAYTTYIEAAYPFIIKDVDLRTGIGVVPWNAMATYGIKRDFYVQNIFISATKMWCIKHTQIGLSTALYWNPATEDVNFVGGINFRM